jgi:hypothetical protein
VAAFLEQDFGVRRLEVLDADLRAGNVHSDRQHGHLAAVAVEQAVDQVQLARPAAACARGELPRELGLRAGGKRRAFLVAHVHQSTVLMRRRLSVKPLSESPTTP